MSVPRDNIAQIGYVVRRESFDDCVAYWRDAMAAGPFFIADFQLADQVFKGQPTDAAIRVALAYHGDIQIELIAQMNDAPSPYLEVLDRTAVIPRAGLFHHYFVMVDDFDVTFDRYIQHGVEPAYMAALPNGDRLTYMDATKTHGYYLEFTDYYQPYRDMFAKMKEVSAAWDGSRPLRSLDELTG